MNKICSPSKNRKWLLQKIKFSESLPVSWEKDLLSQYWGDALVGSKWVGAQAWEFEFEFPSTVFKLGTGNVHTSISPVLELKDMFVNQYIHNMESQIQQETCLEKNSSRHLNSTSGLYMCMHTCVNAPTHIHTHVHKLHTHTHTRLHCPAPWNLDNIWKT